MRRAVVALMGEWWGQMPRDPAPLRHKGYQAYAVLTMCRMLYTLEFGTVVSKQVVAHWAQGVLGERWAALIDRALVWGKGRQDTPDGEVDETLGLIQYTLEQCRVLPARPSST
jgi:hypothetical protein